MGIYLNPNNKSFQMCVNSEIYVDKSLLLEQLNRIVNTQDKFVCVSRPRRFGKSMAESMLSAYYSRGDDSRKLFSSLKIFTTPSFERYLNAFNVIQFDMNEEFRTCPNPEGLIGRITEKIKKEFIHEFSDCAFSDCYSLSECILRVYAETGQTFIIIIDEYDVLVREKVASPLFERYLNFLNGLFKGTAINPAISLAYITGIMPIVRDSVQSKLNNFYEYTMLDAKNLTEFVGFTEKEVQALCSQYNVSFEECKRWYNGYKIKNTEIYNPKSIVEAVRENNFESHWASTGSYETLRDYILLNFNGIKDDIVKMLSGESIAVAVGDFLNTLANFHSKDDVFTYLIHLGYLAYSKEDGQCYIPNREVREEWVKAIKHETDYAPLIKLINNSKNLLQSTIDGASDAVALALDAAHEQVTSPLSYNNEQSFQSAICLAYFYASLQYTIVKELPTGKGYADVVFIPYMPQYPAIIVELKNNRSADTALMQIKDKHYPSSLAHYKGSIILVGINYDEKTKKHTCVIEKME